MTTLEIKQNIEAFELVPCGLKHELVKLDTQTKLPIALKTSDQEEFERIQLCPLKDRNKRLGCAHSASNSQFNRLIDLLDTENTSIKELQNKINDVIFKIYMLDHKKGNLEKDYAASLLKNNTEQGSLIKKELKACILTHTNYIKQLKELKISLLNAIDTIS